MCAPALAIAAAAASAIGTGMSAVQARAQARYQARIADRNARLEGEAATAALDATRQQALAAYRDKAAVQGRQRAAMAANGIDAGFGSAADMIADGDMLAGEDIGRIYAQGLNSVRGFDINAANQRAEAKARRSAGDGALVSGLFSAASTALSGASSFSKLKAQGY